jgi:hypothetical protein
VVVEVELLLLVLEIEILLVDLYLPMLVAKPLLLKPLPQLPPLLQVKVLLPRLLWLL